MATISAILRDVAAGNAVAGSVPQQRRAPVVRPRDEKPRKSTREKIESMVVEGTKNYPAYLKLIYTGESDFSSEDEAERISTKHKAGHGAAGLDGQPNAAAAAVVTETASGDGRPFGDVELDNGQRQEDVAMVKEAQSPSATTTTTTTSAAAAEPKRDDRLFMARIKNKVSSMRKSKSEDSFYDTIETSSPDYGNSPDSQQKSITPEEDAKQRKEMEEELAKLEEEIVTLRTVLSAKVNQASELKRKLGITPIVELKNDVKQGIQNIRQSEALQKTGNAFKSFGAYASKKLGDMRNSATFKSFEEKVGGAYSNVKSRVSGSKSENNFRDVLDREPTIAENPSDGSVLTAEGNK